MDGIEFLAHGIVMDFNSGKVWNFGKQGNLSFEKKIKSKVNRLELEIDIF